MSRHQRMLWRQEGFLLCNNVRDNLNCVLKLLCSLHCNERSNDRSSIHSWGGKNNFKDRERCRLIDSCETWTKLENEQAVNILFSWSPKMAAAWLILSSLYTQLVYSSNPIIVIFVAYLLYRIDPWKGLFKRHSKKQKIQKLFGNKEVEKYSTNSYL